jgi:hypothetical protein
MGYVSFMEFVKGYAVMSKSCPHFRAPFLKLLLFVSLFGVVCVQVLELQFEL